MSNANIRLEYNLNAGTTDFYWQNSKEIAAFYSSVTLSTGNIKGVNYGSWSYAVSNSNQVIVTAIGPGLPMMKQCFTLDQNDSFLIRVDVSGYNKIEPTEKPRIKYTNMTKLFLPFLFATSFTWLAVAQPADYQPSAKESIEWCDIWISHANETNLPRVLLIGDSITRAYYPEVEKHLEGKAYVGRLSSSAFISDPVLLKQIEMVLGQYKFDVIHFNNGMHGWQHNEKEYEQALPKFLKVIQKCAPNAKLIWANTTSLKVSPNLAADNQTQATDERIAARNVIALKLVQAKGIPMDDLNTPMRGRPELHSDNVHFNDQGIALQAAQVAAHIEKQLKP